MKLDYTRRMVYKKRSRGLYRDSRNGREVVAWTAAEARKLLGLRWSEGRNYLYRAAVVIE